jgi:hypothetical protein
MKKVDDDDGDLQHTITGLHNDMNKLIKPISTSLEHSE